MKNNIIRNNPIKNNSIKKKVCAFTLIELSIVLAVVAILLVIGFKGFTHYKWLSLDKNIQASLISCSMLLNSQINNNYSLDLCSYLFDEIIQDNYTIELEQENTGFVLTAVKKQVDVIANYQIDETGNLIVL